MVDRQFYIPVFCDIRLATATWSQPGSESVCLLSIKSQTLQRTTRAIEYPHVPCFLVSHKSRWRSRPPTHRSYLQAEAFLIISPSLPQSRARQRQRKCQMVTLSSNLVASALDKACLIVLDAPDLTNFDRCPPWCIGVTSLFGISK